MIDSMSAGDVKWENFKVTYKHKQDGQDESDELVEVVELAAVTTGSSRHGCAGVSFLIATVGSTFTSPTVALVNACVFCDNVRAVLLTQINS